MRNFIFAALFVAAASVANAASISAVTSPAEGGVLTTVILSVNLEPGESFRGFDTQFDGDVSNENPFGALATVFNDNNAVFANDASVDLSRDSQFLFTSGDILSIGAEEGPGLLKGAISGIQNLGLVETTIPFVQIATSDPSAVNVRLSMDLGGAEPFVPDGSTLQDFIIPEPSTALLAGLALVGFAARRK